MKTRISIALTVLFALVLIQVRLTSAADAPTAIPATNPSAALAQSVCDKALLYLKAQQKPDNSWDGTSDPAPGITSIVLRAFVADAKYDPDMPFIDKAFTKLIGYQKPTGGIYDGAVATYNTAIAISALATSKETEYKATVDKGLAFLKSQQWTDKIAGVPEDQIPKNDKDARWGGFGYGGAQGSRPDMSNVNLALDAMHEAGLKSDDPAFQAALKFVTRSQNLSETNDQPFAGNDGGFIYSPYNGGMSQAGEYMLGDNKMERSYGSMTYAGLKSMIYAGLSHDDPRVKAAWGWISKNYTVSENPGMSANGPEHAQDGLYYYYYTMARALNVYGQPIIVDAQGNKHDWRVDLIQKIATLQKADGSFIGGNDAKWMENNPMLATAYTVIALEIAQQDLKEHPVQ